MSLNISREVHQEIIMLSKGELHVHLNGTVLVDVVMEILKDEGVVIPDGFILPNDLIRYKPCESLIEYLKPWQVLRMIPHKIMNLEKMCDSVFCGLRDSNVRFVELRSSIVYLSHLQCCSIHEAMENLINITGVCAKKIGIRRGIVMTIPRSDASIAHLDLLLGAYSDLGCPKEIVGIDLAGDEDLEVETGLPLKFRMAKDKYGLGVTIHAGETGKVQNIISAIDDFDADRIGHGTAAVLDPLLMERLQSIDVCIEVCPISNRLTGAVGEKMTHPLRDFNKFGVPFVICSDNPGIHRRGLNDDYCMAHIEGVDIGFLKSQYAVAKKYSFLEV